MVHQGLCAPPEVTIIHLGGGLNSCRRFISICLSPLRQGPLPFCFLTAFPLFLQFLSSLLTA